MPHSESELLTPNQFIPGGFTRSIVERLGLHAPSSRIVKIGLLILVTWCPLLCLSLAAGHAWGDQVKFPFLSDPDAFGRYLVALPLLEIATGLISFSLASQMRHFLELGLIPEVASPRFRAAQAELIILRESKLVEAISLLIAIGVPLGLRAVLGIGNRISSWDHVGQAITLAGWWQILVSLPVLFFFFLRRFWIFIVWTWFLFRTSQLNLALSATHPDRAGGLGFVGRGLAGFCLLLMAFSTIFSAGLSDEIMNHGQSLNDLKFHIALFVIPALVVIHAPLLFFCRQMIFCRHDALRELGGFVLRYDRAFDKKWIKEFECKQEEFLGNGDIQTLANVPAGYEHANDMWPIPFDARACLQLVIAALIPMIPLLGAALPLADILKDLGKMLL